MAALALVLFASKRLCNSLHAGSDISVHVGAYGGTCGQLLDYYTDSDKQLLCNF